MTDVNNEIRQMGPIVRELLERFDIPFEQRVFLSILRKHPRTSSEFLKTCFLMGIPEFYELPDVGTVFGIRKEAYLELLPVEDRKRVDWFYESHHPLFNGEDTQFDDEKAMLSRFFEMNNPIDRFKDGTANRIFTINGRPDLYYFLIENID